MISSLSLLLIILYGAIILYFTLFSDRMGRMDPYQTYRYNLHPFTEILRFMTYRHQVSMMAFLINIFGNILVFAPWGFLIPIWDPKRNHARYILMYSFSFSLCIEVLQLFSRVGVFDVDDIIMNTLGGFVGWIIYLIMNYIRKQRRR
ncbi:MAG: VanZ family protein [Eubacteriales bacterium]|nr:VanZ family protein [Eubacteriales bacterium]